MKLLATIAVGSVVIGTYSATKFKNNTGKTPVTQKYDTTSSGSSLNPSALVNGSTKGEIKNEMDSGELIPS